MKPSRREVLRTAAVAASARPQMLQAAALDSHWPRLEGADTPKLALELSIAGPMATSPGMRPMGNIAAGHFDEASMRRVKQLGVNHILMGGPPIPWQEQDIRARMDKLKAAGLSLGNLMIGGFPKTIYGKPGRDEEIEKVRQSIRAAGRAGLPVVEYNFYAHRIVEGYYEETGRAGAGLTAFDYERVKDLPPLPSEGAHTLDEVWANITYFLKAVIPVAEQSGVRMALHPNDPPAPISRGSGRSWELWQAGRSSSTLCRVSPTASHSIAA